jgi:hypothetical protein
MDLNDDEKREARNLFYDESGDIWLCFDHELILSSEKELTGHETCFVVRSSRYQLWIAEGIEREAFGFAIYKPGYFPSKLFISRLAQQLLKTNLGANIERRKDRKRKTEESH